MQIADLQYLEYIPEMELVFGGEGLTAIASASAFGEDEFVDTFTSVDPILGDGRIGIAFAKAVATGAFDGKPPFADTDAQVLGADKSIAITFKVSDPLKESEASRSFAIGILLPGSNH